MDNPPATAFISQQELEATNSYFEAIKGYARHEDGLLNNRVNWCLLFNSFLFTALALLTAAFPQLRVPFPPLEQLGLQKTVYSIAVLSIALTGFVLTISSAMGIIAATKALQKLEGVWIANRDKFAHAQLYPSLLGAGERDADRLGMAYPMLLIAILLLVWLAVSGTAMAL